MGYVEWREHTDAAISGHDRGRERHVTRTATSGSGMQNVKLTDLAPARHRDARV